MKLHNRGNPVKSAMGLEELASIFMGQISHLNIKYRLSRARLFAKRSI